MSVMSQCYSIIIDFGISAPRQDKKVVDGLNSIDKNYIYHLMSNVQLPGSKKNYSSILINYYTQNNDVSLDKEIQKHLSK